MMKNFEATYNGPNEDGLKAGLKYNIKIEDKKVRKPDPKANKICLI